LIIITRVTSFMYVQRSLQPAGIQMQYF